MDIYNNQKKPRHFLIGLSLIIFIFIIILGFYFYGQQLGQLKNLSLLDTSFNYKTTKLATIPMRYPVGKNCEEYDVFHLSCYVTSFSSSSIVFSKSGNNVAYKLYKLKPYKETVVIGDKLAQVSLDSPSSRYSLNYNGRIIFSPDGSKIAYMVVNKVGKLALVINEQQTEFHDFISLPEFSPDGQRMAYVIRDGNSQYAIVDGKKYGSYNEISPLGNNPGNERYFDFTPNSKHFMYIYINTEESGSGASYTNYASYIVVDGVPQGKSWQITNPILINDGSVAYATKDVSPSGAVEKGFVVGNTKKQAAYSTGGSFVTGGNRIAYVDTEYNYSTSKFETYINVAGKQWSHYISDDPFHMKGDLKSDVKLYLSDDENHAAAIYKENDSYKVVVDDKEFNVGNKYNFIGSNVSFSPDGNKFAFVGSWSTGIPGGVSSYLVIIDLRTMQSIENKMSNYAEIIKFTPDSSKIVQLVGQPYNYVIIGDQAGQKYDQIGDLVFSPDGQYVGYGARKGHDLWWIVTKL